MIIRIDDATFELPDSAHWADAIASFVRLTQVVYEYNLKPDEVLMQLEHKLGENIYSKAFENGKANGKNSVIEELKEHGITYKENEGGAADILFNTMSPDPEDYPIWDGE